MSQYPQVRRERTVAVHHGHELIDDFAWMANKQAPEVREYLEAQNAVMAERTADQEPLRQAIFDEIVARTQETDMSVPVRRGRFWYFTRTEKGKSYGISCRAPIRADDDWIPPALDAVDPVGQAPAGLPGEVVLLDLNALAEGHEFFSLGGVSVSEDGNLLAYSTDTSGDERYTGFVVDLRTGAALPDRIEDTTGSLTWSADGRYLFYSTVDAAWRPDSVWRHTLGSDAPAELVLTDPDEKYWVGIGTTRSGKYLLLNAQSKLTQKWWYLPADDPAGVPTPVWETRDGVDYDVEHAMLPDGAGGQRDWFFFVSNLERDGQRAVDFRVDAAPVDDPTALVTVVAPRPGLRIEGLDAFAGHLVLSYRSEALPRFAVADLGAIAATGDPGALTFTEPEFEGELFTAELGSNPEFAAPAVQYGFGSYVIPSRIYNLNLASGSSALLKEQSVLGEFDPANYVQRRLWVAASGDGDGAVQIPVSVVHRADLDIDDESAGPFPTLLYGYGSYEISMDPGFSIARLSLLDRGMVFVVAHVRGGGELGRGWYDDGKILTKQNTFSDFIAVGRELVARNIASPETLVANGGSAGGLLMGVVANQAPELFAGIAAVVPFVDPLTSILDPSLPLTVTEWEEWGDPLHDADAYEYIAGYAPYQNVAPRPYPAILAMTGFNDTRVLYTEPAKWIAALQDATTSGKDVVLRTEMAAGHGGVSGRYERWKETAFLYAWIATTAGIAPA